MTMILVLNNTKRIKKRDCVTVYNVIKTHPIFKLTQGKLWWSSAFSTGFLPEEDDKNMEITKK